ncbi:MAG: hypothetical protein WC790_00355 [Candidatus Paceibacterota bacterium]|jgi:hypothetical protein
MKTSGKRGLGSGADSHKTSLSKPAKLVGFQKTGGDGMGGNVGKAEPEPARATKYKNKKSY